MNGLGFLWDNVKPRATQSEKEKENFARAKEIMDYIDIYFGDYRDEKRINNMKINFDLLNGRLDPKLYEDPLCFSVEKELISFDFQNISHTPLISQYANAIVGEMNGFPFKPMIKDQTPRRLSSKKKRMNKALGEYLQKGVVAHIREGILMDIMKQYGATDLYNFAPTPQAQLELENAVNQKLAQELPKDVIDFINGDVQSPTARQAQRIIDFLVDRFNIRFEQVKGFKNAVVTGEEYYYAGIYDDDLLFEAVNPMYLSWGGGDHENEWSQHADWAKRERWLSYQQIISRHARYLDKKDIEIIDLDVEPIGGYSSGVEFWDKTKPHTQKLMYTYSTDEGFQERFSGVDIRTKEGRQQLFKMYDVAFSRFADKYGNNYSDYGIRESHIQWRDLRKMWLLTQIDSETGDERLFWLPEHYEPTEDDYDVKEVWITQIWEGWKLGTVDSVYSNIRPVPNQYRSILSPKKVQLSYFGKKYNTHDNTTKNSSLMDSAKSAQKNFDIVLAAFRQLMSTNIGPVFTMFLNMRPEGWSYQQWIDLMRNAGILMLDPTRQMSGVDPQFLREINLSKLSEGAYLLQMLEFYKNQVALSMYFNANREGEISEYANSVNTQQNIKATYNKTALFMEQHRLIVQEALTGLLNVGRYYYRLHPEEASIFLDDVSMAELQTSTLSAYDWLGIILQNSLGELEKLNQLKGQVLTFMQNGSSMDTIMEIIFSDTISETEDIVRRETKRMQEMEAAKMKQMQDIEQMKAQNLKQINDDNIKLELEKHYSMLESQERRVLLDREKFAMAQDLDKNQINDLLQKTFMELYTKLVVHKDEMDLEREKLGVMQKIESDKINTENEKVKKMSTKQK